MKIRLTVVFLLLGVVGNGRAGEPEAPDHAASFHFAYHISPIIARSGCSAAECHGGASGKGGFKLSLFSSDPKADFAAITQEFGARRIDYLHPERSLFLKKPSRQLKHKGGKVFATEDPEFQSLRSWIAAGAPWSTGKSQDLVDLHAQSDPDSGKIQVIATFNSADGHSEKLDVTHLAVLESTDTGVVGIDEGGRIVRSGPGEAWILARYAHLSARIPVVKPFSDSPSGDRRVFDHPVDKVWVERLKLFGLAPGPRATDSVLVRRLYIDLVGRPPSPLEVARFHALPAGDRIHRTVDILLENDEFSNTWASHLARWFEVPIGERDPKNSKPTHDALRAYFLNAVKSRLPLDDIAREILTKPEQQRAWKRFSDPRDRAEYIGRSLLGIRIGCARCHNHPLDRWKQDEHLAFSAYFSDPRPDPDGGGMMAGRFFEPETGRQIEPALLPISSGQPAPDLSRQQELVWMVIESGRHQFSKNLANRIFAALAGRALVRDEDDHRLTNPAVHEPMLELLSHELTSSEYDLRSLVRIIATSELYAVSSEPSQSETDLADVRFFGRRESLRLNAEQFRRAVEFVTGTDLDHPLPQESPLSEQLFVINSGLIQKGLEQPGNQVDAIFDFGLDEEQQLQDLFLLVLSRPPTEAERKAFLPVLTDAENPRQRGKDLAFALMAGREFGSHR